MDDIYSKLFFLVLGAVIAWLSNRLSERSRIITEERNKLRSSYSTWLASSRTLAQRIIYVSERARAQTMDPEANELIAEEIEKVLLASDKVFQSMYETYLLEPVEILREYVRLESTIFFQLVTQLRQLRRISELVSLGFKRIELRELLIEKLPDDRKEIERRNIEEGRALFLKEKESMLPDWYKLDSHATKYEKGLDDFVVRLRTLSVPNWRVPFLNRKNRKFLAELRPSISANREALSSETRNEPLSRTDSQ